MSHTYPDWETCELPRRAAVDPTLPKPSWARFYGPVDHHMIRAREAVRRGIVFDRQREQHAIYLNDDDLVHLRECAAGARTEARKHIAEAIAAGWKRSRRTA